MEEISHYTPLPDARQWTRLIEIHSGLDNDSVECVLTTHKLHNLPPYHAISYVWGSPPDTASIILNGETKHIRPNCLAALRQAKHHGGSRYHWIDSLCVNQNNSYEKSCQVEVMGEIFDRATRVLSCIGEHAEGSEAVLQMLGKCPKSLLGAWSGDDFSIKPMLWVLSTSKAELAMVSTGLMALLSRDYFHRVWMLQEVFRKQVRVSICCGLDRQPLSTLYALLHTFRIAALSPFRPHRLAPRLAMAAAANSLINRLSGNKLAAIDESFYFRSHHSRAAALFLLDGSCPGRRRSMRKGGFTTDDGRDGLAEILQLVMHCRCQDPRDRVFATRMLVDWGLDDPIMPDYSMSNFRLALEVLQQFWHTGMKPLLFHVTHLARSLLLHLYDEGTQEAIRRSSETSGAFKRTPGFNLCSHVGWSGICLEEQDIAAIKSVQAGPDCPESLPADHAEISEPQDGGHPGPYVIGDMMRGDWLLFGKNTQFGLLSRPQACGTATISGILLSGNGQLRVRSRAETLFRIMIEHWVALTIALITNLGHGFARSELALDEKAQRLVQQAAQCIFNSEPFSYAEEEPS